MKKVVLSLALVAVLGLSFTSCKKNETAPAEGADTTAVEAPAAPEATVDTAAADTTAADTAKPAAPAAEAPAAAPAH